MWITIFVASKLIYCSTSIFDVYMISIVCLLFLQKKSRRHYSSDEGSSDYEEDLDLSKDLLSIASYVRMKDEMVDHMFRSISRKKLRAMLPDILKVYAILQFKHFSCHMQTRNTLEFYSKICQINSENDSYNMLLLFFSNLTFKNSRLSASDSWKSCQKNEYAVY